MAYQNQFPQPTGQPSNYNHGPGGDLRSQHSNGPLPTNQFAAHAAHRNGIHPAISHSGGARPGLDSSLKMGMTGGQQMYPSQGNKPQQYPPNALAHNQPPSGPGGYTMQQHPPLLNMSASQEHKPGIPSSMGMPLHGSGSSTVNNQVPSGFSHGYVGLSGPTLPGQQFKSYTPPPPSSSARHSPASSVQGQNASSSRSTPTHMLPPNITSGHGAFKPLQQPSNTFAPPLPGQMTHGSTPMNAQQPGRQEPPFLGQMHIPHAGHTQAVSNHPGPAMQPPPLPCQQYTPQKLGPPTSAGPPLAQGFSSQPDQLGANLQPLPLPGQSYTLQTKTVPNQQGAWRQPPPLSGQPYSQQIGPPTNQHGGPIQPPPLTGQPYAPASRQPPPPSGQPYSPRTGPPTNQHGGPMQPPPLTGQPYAPASIRPPPLPGAMPPQSSNGSVPMNSSAAAAQAVPTSGYYSAPANAAQPPSYSGRQPVPGSYPGGMPNLTNSMGNMRMNEADRPINLMQESRILPSCKPFEIPLQFESSTERGFLIPPDRKNCQPDVLRCTLKAIPQTQSLLNKVKLPLGLVIHPFKDLSSLPVISAGTIVRCKRCRTYINPFVSFLDERKWRCNMCFAVNDSPEEFLHHPVTKTYGQPHTRPECTNSTLEFIAPQEYMLRPPQPAVYLFLLDVSHSAIESGYLQVVCDSLLEHLDRLPGDSRTKIGFLTYNATIHFYRLTEGSPQPQMMIVSDIDDVFLPTPENLLVNLRESKDLVQDLLHLLPSIHNINYVGEGDTYSALGAALEVAKKLMSPFGGRVTVFQQSIPNVGPGALKPREDANIRAGETPTSVLNPATDNYKKMALECSSHQVAIDIFFFNSQYVDIATLSCSSRFSAGDLHYYPSLHVTHNPMEVERLVHDLERYLTRKIGFESVMRIRCTKGFAVHTFHGNFFVRSTDLLALANVNPDSGYAVNLTIEDPLTDLSAACFQAALLYTTSKGERRIRVHTMCVPVVKTPAEVLSSVDCIAAVSLLAKMGVDRSVTASIPDARDALLNAVIDPLKVYKDTLPQGMTTGGVYVPRCLRLLPLYMHCLLKHPAFRLGVSTKLDDRVFAMINFKMQPASYLLQSIHPDLYRVDDLHDEVSIKVPGRDVPRPNILPLSAESILQTGAFLLDCGWKMYLLVGRQTSRSFINDVLGAEQFSNLEEPMYAIPELENPASELFHSFLEWLQDSRPHHAPIRVIRDDVRERLLFFSLMLQDRTESSMSLQEFLIHVQQQLNR